VVHHALHHPLAFFFYYLPRGLICKPAEIVHEWETIARTAPRRSNRILVQSSLPPRSSTTA
jgi:hypothetical protein